MEEIDEQNRKYAHRLFQCVAAASRPLLVNELAEFLAFDFEAGSIPTYLADWRPEDPVHTVLSICSSLLVVIKQGEGSPVVQFAHFSVKEYLTSARLSEAKDAISHFHVSMSPAHTIVAQACLGVLLHLDENITKDSLEKFPLVEYAAEHWVGHARSENVSSNVEDGIKRLFDPSKSHFCVWTWIYDPECSWLRFERSERPENARATPLHYVAFCGLHDLAPVLISEHLQDVNAPGFDEQETPLHVASRRGHAHIALLLLEHGADAKAQDDKKRTPLVVASEIGHVEVVRALLEHGADTEAQDNEKRTPLLLASRVGNVEVARVLLEHGADTEAQDNEKLTPLLLASKGGQVEVARVLLEHGVDTEVRDERDFSPLDWASAVGHTELVRVLLKHGVNAKAQDRIGFTALHLAAGEEVARLLLKHDADANAPKNDGRTPLHHLSYLGREGAARVLLEHGVDVNARDATNATPLHVASGEEKFDAVRLLLQYSADIHARDDKGQTPFMIATEKGHYRTMNLLLEHGGEDLISEAVGPDGD